MPAFMKQVEIWLSILVRKVLKRGNFLSLDDLRTQILAFIAYYNRTMYGYTHQVDLHWTGFIKERCTPQSSSAMLAFLSR
jgi:hypothetical protein